MAAIILVLLVFVVAATAIPNAFASKLEALRSCIHPVVLLH